MLLRAGTGALALAALISCSAGTSAKGHGSGVGAGGSRSARGSLDAAVGTSKSACAIGCDASDGAGALYTAKRDSSTAPTARDAAVEDSGAHSTLDASTRPQPLVDASSASTRPVASPPGYMGSADDGPDCNTPYPTLGFEPVDAPATRHPLFLYFVGTTFVAGDQSSQYDSQAARAVTEAMARRGFVALTVQYDNGALAWLSDHKNQLDCLFASAQAGNLLAAACGLPSVDCNLGIATWGHSQGAYVAISAASFDSRVRAAWLTGYGGDASSSLSKDRLRVVNGEADTTNGTVAVLNSIAGFTTTECPDDGRSVCLRNDGSGWIIVRKQDVVVSSADHCWFDKPSCTDNTVTLEPSWIDPASDKPFALQRNADWIAQATQRP